MNLFANMTRFQWKLARLVVVLGVAGVLCAQPIAARMGNAPLSSCYSTGSGNWTDPSIWANCNGGYPGQTTNDYVTIKAGTTVTLNSSPPSAIYALEIENGATFNGGSSTTTLAFSSSGGTPGIINNGTFNAQTGTIAFNSSYGSTTQTVSGSNITTFNNVTIGSVAVNFQGGSNPAVIGGSGTLTLNNGGSVVTSKAPNYASGSTLKYNTGTTTTAGEEWYPNTTSGPGVPSNVQIGSGTTLTFGSTSTPRTMTGNLIIDGALQLSTAGGGDLKIGGSWTNNGTFTPNSRQVTFNGTGAQTISGTSTTTFAYLEIAKTSGGSVTLNSNINVTDELKITSGTLDAGSTTITMGTASSATHGADFINNGTFTAGTSTVVFTGTGNKNSRILGTSTTTFNNVTITPTLVGTDKRFGVDFYDQNNSTHRAEIAGILTLNQFGFVATLEDGTGGACVNPNCDGRPTYLSTSTLKYNNTSSFDSAAEWWPGNCGDPGVPYNVEIANSTTVNINKNFDNGGGGKTPIYSASSNKTACGNVTIDAGSTLQSTAGILDVKKNWTNNGSFTSNNGTVLFDGTSTQVIGGTALTDFYNLTLNNSNGVNLGVAADANQQVENTLTLTSTLLTIGPNNLTMGQNANAVGGSLGVSNMVVADSTGSMCKVGTSTTNADFYFPIGDSAASSDGANYSPINIDYSAISGNETTCVRVVDAVEPNNTSVDKPSRYWPISTTGLSASTATLTGYYTDADVAGTTESNILGGIDVGTNNWTVYAGVDTSANTVPAGGSTLLVDSNGTVNFTGIDSSLPATIAWFRASAAPRGRGNGLSFDWQTAQQVGVVGFNIYAQTPQGRVKINKTLIPSQRANSFTPLMYHYEAVVKDATAFYIEHVDARGGSRAIGPFAQEKDYGSPITLQKTDWAGIRAQRAAEMQTQSASGGASLPQAVDLGVSQTGIYRLSFETLLAAGYDFGGVSAADIALIKNGAGVPIYLSGPAAFGPGSFIEFYGEALDTLYTKTNVYHLRVDGALAARVAEDNAAISPDAIAPAYYMETSAVKKNKEYSFAAPNGDPWIEEGILAYTAPVERDYVIPVDNMVAAPGVAPSLALSVWGSTDWPQAPDHRVVAALNGANTLTATFDGITAQTLAGEVSAALVVNGNNTLKVRLPADTGVDYDLVNVVGYGLTYPRAFVPRNGALAFTATGDVFEISGLAASSTSAWRKDASGLARLSVTSGGAGARLRGTGAPARYTAQSVAALLSPALMAVPPQTDITSGQARFLVIAHPDFIGGLQPLVNFHQQRGWQTKVVNAQDVYAQFGDGVFGPQAIRAYIAYAAQHMNTQAVMLVGGDSYDYFNYLNTGAISFIPTLYAPTDALVQFAPVDPLFTDLNNDGIPDLPIGRLPVKTPQELNILTQKILAYASKSYARTALFAEDTNDAMMNFKQAGQNFAAQLPSNWAVSHASVNDIGATAAHDAIINNFNQGRALITFIGHSGPTSWGDLWVFHTSDARNLQNAGKPAVVVQWGCWNTYFVEPQYQTMGDALLLDGDRGAAGVMGATALTQIPSNELLGRALTTRLGQPGATLGGALQTAKEDLAATNPNLKDAFQAWTLLGDPLLMLDNLQYKVFIPFTGSGYPASW